MSDDLETSEVSIEEALEELIEAQNATTKAVSKTSSVVNKNTALLEFAVRDFDDRKIQLNEMLSNANMAAKGIEKTREKMDRMAAEIVEDRRELRAVLKELRGLQESQSDTLDRIRMRSDEMGSRLAGFKWSGRLAWVTLAVFWWILIWGVTRS